MVRTVMEKNPDSRVGEDKTQVAQRSEGQVEYFKSIQHQSRK